MKYHNSFKLLILSSAFCAISLTLAQASTLTFEPNNVAVFSDANPNGNTAMMATVVKPKNTGVNPTPTGLLGQSTATTLQQALISQLTSQINNKIFNCGTNCPDGSVVINGQTILNHSTDPVTGDLILGIVGSDGTVTNIDLTTTPTGR